VEKTRLISVVGKKHCGKTTLVVALAAEFARQGKRVGTLKHGTHPANVDHEGTDTWRHFNEGLAERVLIESSGQRVLFQRLHEESGPVALTRQFMVGIDIVIAEGFTRHTVPKIEVFRSVEHEKPHFDPSRSNAADWCVMITDDDAGAYPFPTLKFSDTAWLVTLSKMAWHHALMVEE
jgi:molybdopterin-guanine dinucleotide biosynthesis protein B